MKSLQLQKLFNHGRKGNILDRLEELEQSQEFAEILHTNTGKLSDISPDLGDVYAGRFIAPSSVATDAEPSSTDFTGVFMSADGETFSGSTDVYNIGAVANGVLQAGFNTSGKLLAGAGNVTLDGNGISIQSSTSVIPSAINALKFSGTWIWERYESPAADFKILTPQTEIENGDSQVTILARNTESANVNFSGLTATINTSIKNIKLLAYTTATGTNEITLSTSGLIIDIDNGNIVLNEQGANTDTRIEGDADIDLFVVDASADKIGISTNAPVELLDVDGTLGAASLYLDEAATPSTPSSGKGVLYFSTDGNPYAVNSSSDNMRLSAYGWPQTVMQFAQQFIWSATGAFTNTATQRFGFYFGPTAGNANNGDTIDMSFVIAPGTYTFSYAAVTSGDCGIVDGTLDGVSIFTGDDHYSAVPTGNVIFSHSITIATGGRHTIRLTVNGKNGSSSDYRVLLTDMYIVPTAYTVEA